MARYIDADALKLPSELPVDPYDDPYFRGMYSGWNNAIRECREQIDSAPTVSSDEVRGVGKWEQKEIYGVEETTIEQMQSACCSVCRKYHTTPYLYYFDKYNYCPNCGAMMEVSE